MDFCHMLENLFVNKVKNEWIQQQKQEQMLQKLPQKE